MGTGGGTGGHTWRDLVILLVLLALLFLTAFVFRATTYPYYGPVPATRVGADVTREEAERDPNAALARLSTYGDGTPPGVSGAHPSSVTGEPVSADWEARTLELEVHGRHAGPAGVMEGLHVELGFGPELRREVEVALAAGGEWYVLYFNGTEPDTFSIYSLSPEEDESSLAASGGTAG